MNPSNDLLSITGFLSVLMHAVIILGVSFKIPDTANIENSDNTLDVVLVTNTNNITPVSAETVSLNDNEGGGLDEESPSAPRIYKRVNEAPIESRKLIAEANMNTVIEPKQVITNKDSDLMVTKVTPKNEALKSDNPLTGTDKVSTQAKRRLEKKRLIAKLQKDWQDYQQRPRKEYLSPTTKKNEAANYLESWRKKVEQVGNANYPEQARINRLNGTLILSVELNRNGTISSLDILKPSRHKILNDAAIRFVRNASPYASFPDEMNSEIDIIVITRTFHFLENNSLTSTDAASQR